MNETLRFVSDNVFAEMAPTPGSSEPLEWRRSFNFLRFEVGKLTLETVYEVNDLDLVGRVSGAADGNSCVQPATKTIRKIRGVAMQDNMRDILLRTVPASPGSNLFKLQDLGGEISVTIVDSAPKGNGGDPGEASYPGVLLPVDGMGEGNVWALEISIPSAQMDDLSRSLRAHEVDTITAGVAVQSFSYELDDALRDWNDRRRIFIHQDVAAAPCCHLVAHKRQQPPSIDVPAKLERQESPQPSPPLTTVASPFDYKAALAGIKAALWAIAVVEFLRFLK